jgi:hypothetical protein
VVEREVRERGLSLRAADLPLDQDWFKIWVNSRQDLDARIRFTNSTGDLDLYLYDANLNLIDWSEGSGDEEQVGAANVPTSGYYYLQIAGYQEADNGYSMHLWLSDCGVAFSKFGQGLAGKGGFVPSLSGTDGGCTDGAHSVHITKGLGGAPAAAATSTSTCRVPGGSSR